MRRTKYNLYLITGYNINLFFNSQYFNVHNKIKNINKGQVLTFLGILVYNLTTYVR